VLFRSGEKMLPFKYHKLGDLLFTELKFIISKEGKDLILHFFKFGLFLKH
jgi:hypothetical protein